MKKDKEISGSFDSLYQGVITKLFNQILDNRADNSIYDLVDSLKSGFAIYSLKCASLFSFRKRSKAEDHNLKAVYEIKKIPSDNGLRKILDKVDPEKIREGFHGLFERIRVLGILPAYWRNHACAPIIELIAPCWQFVIAIKPAGNKHLFEQFEALGSVVRSYKDKQGEHHFGHGKSNLCIAYLMMLSFCVDQIQQSSSVFFQKLLEDLKTRVKLWESLRAALKILPCKNMTEVFFCIADMYQIKLE